MDIKHLVTEGLKYVPSEVEEKEDYCVGLIFLGLKASCEKYNIPEEDKKYMIGKAMIECLNCLSNQRVGVLN